MADKDLARVDVVVGAVSDKKSAQRAAKELAESAATQSIKIPVALDKSSLDKLLAGLPSAPSSSNSDFKKLKSSVGEFIAEQKKLNKAEDELTRSVLRFYKALDKQAAAFEAQKIADDDKFIKAMEDRGLAAEKASLQEAKQEATFYNNKKKADDRFINALYKRTSGLEKLVILEATEATLAETSSSDSRTRKAAADDKFLNAVYKKANSAEKAAILEATEEKAFYNKKNKNDDKFLNAVYKKAILTERAGIQEATEATEYAKQEEEARQKKNDADDKFLNAVFKRTAGMEKIVLAEERERGLVEKRTKNKEARAAGQQFEKSTKDTSNAVGSKVLDADKQLFLTQQERINEIRTAISLQRLQNKQLEKQGRLVSPTAIAGPSVSTSAFGDGISSANQSILGVAKIFGQASIGAIKFVKEITVSAALQVKLNSDLLAQKQKIDNSNRIIQSNNNSLSETNKLIKLYQESYSKNSRTAKNEQLQLETNTKITREIFLKRADMLQSLNDANTRIREAFDIDPSQANGLKEFFIASGNIDAAEKIGKLIKEREKTEARYNDLLQKQSSIDNQVFDNKDKIKNSERKTLESINRLKELYTKKKNLEQENFSVEQQLVSAQKGRLRTLTELAAAEARGLVKRAVNFVSGGRGGSGGGGNGGAPPNSPGGNNRGGGGGGKDNQFKNAAAGINAFNTGMARSLTFLEKIRLNLNEADKAALQFGQSARFSTDRLLAFAAPSALIFKLSSAIRTASQDLIQLDTQARRLVFFEEAGRSGGLAKFNKDINDSSKRSKLLGDAFKNIADEANRTGLAMNIVTEAAQTVTRIGEISFLPTGASSDFLKATLGLTQIEAGALNSERAAEILKATLAQFGLEATQVTAVAAKFATVANETSVNVEQLATLVTRFGSAAINVQNLNFDQTLALASISAKTLGTNTFRTATALRQLTTKLVDNIDKIKELSGIEIQVGEGGQLRGIESLLEVLEKVNQFGQTGTGVELAKLIGDRENLSDIFALAKVVPELRGSIAKLADTQNVAAQTSQQIAAFLNVVGLQSDSVESSINRLNTSFAQFLNSAGTTSILDGIVKSLTSLVKLATDVSTSIGGLGGVISALGPIAAVAFGSIAKKGILSLVGFINGPESKAQFKKSIEELLNTPAKRKETIELLNKQGLVNIEAGNRFLQIQNTLEAQKLAIEKQIQSIKVIINNEEKNTIQDLKKIENLERNRLALEKQLENSIRRQQASTKDLLNQNLTGFALLKKQFTENAGGLISGGLATSGAVISQLIPSFIDNPETQQKVESSVIKVFSSAALGAQVGSIFGPKGAVGGAIIGGLIGTVQQGADKIAEILAKNFRFRGGPDENQEELDAEGRQQKRAITVIRANIAARDFAIKQAERQAEATESAIRAEERLNSLRTINTDIVSIEAKINEFRSKGFNIADLLLRLQVKVAERRTLELQTSKDIVNEEARRLKVLEKISALELQQETRSTLRDIEKNTAQQLNKINRGGELTSLQIGIEFDRKQVQDKIKSLESLRDIRVVALAETTAEKTDERSRIQKEILDIEKKIVSEKIQANKSIRDEQFAIFEKQEEIIRTTIDGYREAAAALIEANNRVFAQNKQIAGLVIDRNGLADRRAENRSRPSNETPFTGAQRDIKDATESLKRTQNVRDPSLTSNRLFVKDLGGQFKAAAARLKELDGIYKLNQDSLSLEIQTRKTLLEAEQNNFEQQIGFERDNLESRKESAERLISKQQELIAAEVKMIEVIKERAKQEAEFGRNLLEAPEEAFQNLKNLDLAQQFLNVDKELNSRGTRQRFDADKSGGLSAQERDTARNSILEDRLSKLLAQSGGRGITQQILEGLKFAGGLATDPFTGVGGALANEELLARLIGGGSVPTKPGETSQLDRQESTIENRRKQLDETFKSMDAIINQQLELEKKVKATETERLSLIQAQVEQLKNVKLNEAFIGAAQAAIRFKETVDGSKPAFDKINEIANKTVTNENVERLLKDLSSASENLNRIASDNGLQGEQIASSLGGTFNEAISNLSESLNSIRVEVLAEVSPINVQLEGTIKQTLDSEQLATALGRELIGTGLEDRVSEIQGIITRLVEISKAQGNKFPPAPPK